MQDDHIRIPFNPYVLSYMSNGILELLTARGETKWISVHFRTSDLVYASTALSRHEEDLFSDPPSLLMERRLTQQ